MDEPQRRYVTRWRKFYWSFEAHILRWFTTRPSDFWHPWQRIKWRIAATRVRLGFWLIDPYWGIFETLLWRRGSDFRDLMEQVESARRPLEPPLS